MYPRASWWSRTIWSLVVMEVTGCQDGNIPIVSIDMTWSSEAVGDPTKQVSIGSQNRRGGISGRREEPFIVDEDCPPKTFADADFPFGDLPVLWILM